MNSNISGTGVQYCIFRTAWGKAGLAWTDRGVCNVVLPGLGSGEIRERDLEEFPGAAREDGPETDKAVAAIRSYFRGEEKKLKARVDLSWATPFQAAVYRALMRIPYGRTRSYQEVAEMAGRPGACRAVGSANGRNRVPLIIPCHRVIKSDGGLGGFSGPGGVKLKKRLLELEGVIVR